MNNCSTKSKVIIFTLMFILSCIKNVIKNDDRPEVTILYLLKKKVIKIHCVIDKSYFQHFTSQHKFI